MEKTDRPGDPPPGVRPLNVMETPLPPAQLSQPPPVAKPQPPRQQTREVRSPPPVAASSAAAAAKGKGGAAQSPPVEFRGFDFFAKREFNELKSASEAYFAPAAAASSRASRRLSRALGPASWLRDPTPPEVPPEGLPPAEGRFPIPIGGKNELPSLTTASDTWSRRSNTRVCGLRKSRFYMLVGLLVGLIIVVVAVGVGVGVGKRTAGASDAAEAVSSGAASSGSSHPTPTTAGAPTSLSTTTATTTVSPTTSSTNPASTAGKLDCPAANGTEYQVPGSNKRFLRVCGVDYSGDSGGIDLKQVTTQSMLDCMTNCAGTYGCTGCGWGYMEGDSGYEHRCWLKSKLMKPQDTDINWSFAVLQ
ncbi:hypothetical protein PG995_015419 [Apiospora arundinis]|uniref:Major capsid protein L1 n=1 Tax=Apiospora arundinis TaxID=335852 RepID=A0ABR2IFA6_9PEZI